jgi:predicted metalloprotease
MLWRGRRQSSNIDDRRGFGGKGVAVGGGIVGLIIYALVQFLGGGNFQQFIPQQESRPLTEAEQKIDDERASIVKVVLAETEDVWAKVFQSEGLDYKAPTLVMFRDQVSSACGSTSSATGPFYCPGDEQVYIDLSFYDDMAYKLRADGDFAMAYVIAHEVGHHIQNLMGVSEKMNQLRQQMSETEYNKYSVMQELQADFYAGVWAHHAQAMDTLLEQGDIEEAMNAANAIGDDRLQKQSQGYVVPDAFTHGTSEQRMYWFRKGFQTGDIKQGDTFNDPSLKN